MLRTALIGFPSSGKTTLFQLMTSQHEAPKAGHGKLEAVVGVARVPDARVDQLAELYQPKKKTPARRNLTFFSPSLPPLLSTCSTATPANR